MIEPTIHVTSPRGYSSVWLKYVRAVDLTQHCIRSLVGERHRGGIDTAAERMHLALDEHALAPAYYLCAVSRPYALDRNAHLLAVPKAGHRETYESAGMGMQLVDLKSVPILATSVPPDDPHRGERLYVTCRNYQAAHWLHAELGLDDVSARARTLHSG